MKLLMISGDRGVASGKPCAFFHTLQGLSPHFDRIDVICPRVAGSAVASVHGNVFLHPSPWPLLLQSAWILKKGRRLIAEHGHTAMTAQEYPPFYNGIGAMRLSRRTGVPACIEIHHIVGWPRAADLGELLGRLLSRVMLPFIAKRVKAVRVVNRTVRGQLVSWGVAPESVHIVPSFYLDAQALRPAEGEPQCDVAFCARLVPNKQLDVFLRAVALLPGASAVVIGDGPGRSEGEALAKSLGIADRVRFAGWMEKDAQLAALRGAKTLVMCSLSEGGPRVVLEAMACSVVPVATAVGIVPEVIDGENGLLTTGTPEDIAAKVGAVLGDEARRRSMAERGRAAVLPRFDGEVTLPAYAQYLRWLA